LGPKRKKRNFLLIALAVFFVSAVVSFLAVFIFLVSIWFSTDPEKMMPPVGVPTPMDGSGAAIIVPDVVRAGDRVDNYTISYTAGPNGLMNGATINLFYPSQLVTHGDKSKMYVPYLAWESMREFISAKVTATTSGKAQLAVNKPDLKRVIRLVFGYYRSKWEHGRPAYSIRDLAREVVRRTIRVIDGEVAAGEEIHIVVGGDGGINAPNYAGWVNFTIEIDGDGDGVALPVEVSPRVVIMGRKATRFSVVATSVANIWEKVRVVIEAVDDDGQIDPTYTGTVYLDAPKLALPSRTQFEISDLGRKSFKVRTTEEGVFFIAARDPRKRRGRSNPIVVREKGPHLFWGDLHMRSVLGMGDTHPEKVLRTARDEFNLNFAAVAMVDNGIPLESHDKLRNLSESEFSWSYLQKITHLFDKKDRFVAFPAFDWASNRFGHRMVIYSPYEIGTEILSHADGRYDTVDKLFAGLSNRRAIVMPVWSGWRGGKYMGKKYMWGNNNHVHQRLVEIYSSDGAVEYCKNPFSIHGVEVDPGLYDPSDRASCSSGAYVRDALANGAKFGVVAGGARRLSLDRGEHYTPGLTAVWADNLNSREIWDGLYSRRAYATTGPRIYVDFKVAGEYPGGEVEPAMAVAIDLFIVGTAPIVEAKIIKFVTEYETTRILSSTSEILHSRWIDRDPPSGGFYFLRVLQEDGNIAWAGPIWVKK